MQISEIMSKDVVTVTPDETVALASRLLSRHNIGSMPVCQKDGIIRGVITDRDIVLRCVANDCDPHETPVRDVMSRSVITAAPSDSVSRVSEIMGQAQVRRLPVAVDGKLVGVVAMADIARRGSCHMEAADALCDISSNLSKK